jgi:hypothetical protein
MASLAARLKDVPLPATVEGQGKMPSRQPAGRRRYSLFFAGDEGVPFPTIYEMGDGL